jgi:hypothetical protein
MKFTSNLMVMALLMPAAALAAEPAPREIGVESSIAFPTYGGVRNFRADDERGVWIEDLRRNWYYASFLGHCRDIRWADAIAIDTHGSSRFDRNSRIIVGDDVCALETLVSADKPLPLKEQRRFAKEAREMLDSGTLN